MKRSIADRIEIIESLAGLSEDEIVTDLMDNDFDPIDAWLIVRGYDRKNRDHLRAIADMTDQFVIFEMPQNPTLDQDPVFDIMLGLDKPNAPFILDFCRIFDITADRLWPLDHPGSVPGYLVEAAAYQLRQMRQFGHNVPPGLEQFVNRVYQRGLMAGQATDPISNKKFSDILTDAEAYRALARVLELAPLLTQYGLPGHERLDSVAQKIEVMKEALLAKQDFLRGTVSARRRAVSQDVTLLAETNARRDACARAVAYNSRKLVSTYTKAVLINRKKARRTLRTMPNSFARFRKDCNEREVFLEPKGAHVIGLKISSSGVMKEFAHQVERGFKLAASYQQECQKLRAARAELQTHQAVIHSDAMHDYLKDCANKQVIEDILPDVYPRRKRPILHLKNKVFHHA